MLDENLIATLEQSLQQTRSNQNRLMARLREVEDEARNLRKEIEALEKFANQTESNIDGLLVTMRAGNRIRMGNWQLLDRPQSQGGTHLLASEPSL